MPMSVEIPDHLLPFVQSVVEGGQFTSESALVVRAVELYREACDKHAALKADVRQGLDALERGEGGPLDIDATLDTVSSQFENKNSEK